MAVYCSRSCQSQDWAIHKKVCKKQLLPRHKQYVKEKNGEVAVPQNEIHMGKQMLKNFDRNKMRFKVGDVVECSVGPQTYLPGTVLQVLHECEGTTHAYQVQLDRQACHSAGMPCGLIWAIGIMTAEFD
jgi:MYND finger